MKISELAKELDVSSKDILEKLKSLKLKAKGSNQELNAVVLSVVRSEFGKKGKASAKEGKEVKPKVKTETKKKVKASAAKKASKEKEEKPKTAKIKKKTAKAEEKTAKKTTVKKKVVKKKVKTVVKKAEKPKSRIQISDQPFVTVKPLQKKRRKAADPGRSSAPAAERPADVVQPGAGVSADEAGSGASVANAQLLDKGPLKDLEVRTPIVLKDLAVKMQQKPSVVLKALMQKGVLAHINQNLDESVVKFLAAEFGFNVKEVKSQEEHLFATHKVEEDDPSLLKPRAPVVTLMGHVDHGKTTLLDKIRKSKVADSEHGAITQHIGAYSVQLPKGRITFLDTPGHEAFTSMRARGAHITDIIILIVAADEGIMPQTEEAIDHARAAEVPIVVAITKIDKRNADVDKVKKQLADHDLNPEDWGGKTIVVGVSAVTGEGVNELLEMMLLEAELLELKANSEKKALGIIVEAHLSGGRGTVASLIVQNGTLKEGDVIISGPHYGKIKAMFDDHQRPIKEAGPSTPVEILGLPGAPEAGELFYVVQNEVQAKEIALKRQLELKDQQLHATQKITLEDLYSQIQKGTLKELNVIIKSDVQGSLEALKDSLGKIPNDQIQLKFIHTGLGDINASDVILAIASNAIIIGFHVSVGPRAKVELEKQEVDIRTYRLIYDAVNDMKNALEGMLEPKKKKVFLGRVEIREVLKLSKGTVAGCFVTKGKVYRKSDVDLLRNGEVVFSGKLSSLKRFKDDVREVAEGFECGITIDGFKEIQSGDIIEAYEIEQIARKL